MKYLLLISIAFVIWVGYNIYQMEQFYNWLEKETEWCYQKGGTMIQAQCVKLERLDRFTN